MTTDSEDKTAIAHDQTMFFQRPAASGQANRITITEGEPHRKVCRFGDSIVIGRSSKCQLTIENDPYVSREHARIERHGKKKYRLINIESKNSTLLNGKEITKPAIIKSGAKVKIGDTTLKVDLDGSKVVADNTGVMSGKTKIALSILAVLIGAVLVLKMIPSTSPDVQVYLEKGNQLFKQEQYEDAKLKFQQVLDIDNENEEADAKKKECEAKIIEQDKRNKIEQFLGDGQKCFENRDYPCALEAFENVLKLDTKNLTAIQKAGECKAKIEEKKKQNTEQIANWLNTAEKLTESLKQNELTDLETLKEAHRHLDKAKNDVNEAIRLCDQIKNLAGDDTCRKADDILENIQKTGKEINEQKQRLEEVLSLYEKAKDFSDRDDHYNALKVLEQLVKMNVACVQSINARKFIPRLKQMLIASVKSDYNKGRKHFKNKKYSKAIAYLHKVYLVYPEYSDIKNLYDDTIRKLEPIAQKLIAEGNVYEGIGKMDEARKKWNKALQIIPIETDELHQEAKRKLSGQ